MMSDECSKGEAGGSKDDGDSQDDDGDAEPLDGAGGGMIGGVVVGWRVHGGLLR